MNEAHLKEQRLIKKMSQDILQRMEVEREYFKDAFHDVARQNQVLWPQDGARYIHLFDATKRCINRLRKTRNPGHSHAVKKKFRKSVKIALSIEQEFRLDRKRLASGERECD